MKMKNLGKIIILFLIVTPLFSNVSVSVDKDTVSRGEEVVFILSIKGRGKVKVPPFDNICGYNLESQRQARRESYSNGEYSQELSLMYSFFPQKSCTIDSFPVSVNGEEFQTKEINITVTKAPIRGNEPFVVDLKTDKKSIYVGEPFEMKVFLKQLKNIQVLDSAISLNDSKNIWVKSQKNLKNYLSDGYNVQENIYAISAQQSGKLSLGPLRWDLQIIDKSKDYWGMTRVSAKRKTAFSNETDIEVEELPEGVSLVGDANIEVKVDKKEINSGEAVNLSIEVKGHLNIEDIQAFNIHLKDAQAFNEDPKLMHYIKDGKYFGVFTQKSAIVAQKDFEIPSFELKYMDTSTDTVKVIKSEAIQIKVLNPINVEKKELKVSRPIEPIKEPQTESTAFTSLQAVLFTLAGFVLGLIASKLPWREIFNREKQKKNISAKESKELLQLLMGHMSEDKEIEELVRKLSENMYEGKTHNIDKKRLKEITKRLQA